MTNISIIFFFSLPKQIQQYLSNTYAKANSIQSHQEFERMALQDRSAK